MTKTELQLALAGFRNRSKARCGNHGLVSQSTPDLDPRITTYNADRVADLDVFDASSDSDDFTHTVAAENVRQRRLGLNSEVGSP